MSIWTGLAGPVLASVISLIPGMAQNSGASENAIRRELEQIKKQFEQQEKRWNSTAEILFDLLGKLGERINKLENPSVPLWAMNMHYDPGDIVVYKDRKFQCIQGHDSYAYNWQPLQAPSLWKGIG